MKKLGELYVRNKTIAHKNLEQNTFQLPFKIIL